MMFLAFFLITKQNEPEVHSVLEKMINLIHLPRENFFSEFQNPSYSHRRLEPYYSVQKHNKMCQHNLFFPWIPMNRAFSHQFGLLAIC